MLFIGVDLGSTNIKAALYDGAFKCLHMESAAVSYVRENGCVEFDADAYVSDLIGILHRLAASGAADGRSISGITFTGQAESLVVLDGGGNPLMNAISWMDERSEEECGLLEKRFPPAACYAHTGQPAVLPTWPATKILWLRRHRPDLYAAAAHYVLLKDFVVYRLTGSLLADCSIATFTFYFDIYERRYWAEMLEFIGVRENQLPPLAEPCASAGRLKKDAARAIGVGEGTTVNIGTLDHFAGMVGTGNVHAGCMSLSTGTVMGLSAIAALPVRQDTGIPMHYGFLPGSYVMLPVAESGGISLEWFRQTCMAGVSYDELNAALDGRAPSELIFLPYIVGTNAPEFDRDACGVFFGLRSKHDAFDLALAVMEGVAHLLKKNCDRIRAGGTPIERIIATGGGAKSPVWCQMQADITGIPVHIPAEKEAACLGAAMIGAVAAGEYCSYDDAAAAAVRMERCFLPSPDAQYARKHRQFLALYSAMIDVQRIR
ncbi:MAG TPA: FGGY family carbohydrate kinase [Feifaniaceae bacterium]|nr:FGGY family carbohydrate kinase [Feifaniaceae bacterium]